MTTVHRKKGFRALVATLLAIVGALVSALSWAGPALAAPGGPTRAAGPPVRSSGCARTPAESVTNQRQDVEVAGSSRWYLLTTPAPPGPTERSGGASSAPVPRPLVVDFHGLAEGATVHSATSRFGALGQEDGFVAVFPNGTGSPVHWDTTDRPPHNPDLTFVSAMLDKLESTQCIDTSRVYASGLSDGSFMVSLVACTMSNRFAAIGAVSGLQLPKPCRTTRGVPVIAFHGTADPILFFNGGIGTATLNRILGTGSGSSSTTTTTQPVKLHGAGYPATVQAWAVKDGCNPRSTDTRLASQIILRSYTCPAGTSVRFYIVLGGGHAWPGSTFSQSISSITGFTTFQINATDQMWTFFQRFRLPSPPPS
ncbi:MAG TPA: PHB depolymerase family esterase [Acidimicrobiales bacterium]